MSSQNENKICIQHFRDQSKEQLLKKPSQETQQDDFDRCLICSDVATFPVKCKKCNAICCKRCADKWKQRSLICPQKCSSDWQYIQIQSRETQLSCPYSLQCIQILYPETYDNHLLECLFIPNQIVQELCHKYRYQCDLNHPLNFINGELQQLINLPCHDCNQFKLCRSQCKFCQILFCIQCRPLPFCKGLCLSRKHRYKFSRKNPNAVCDVCGSGSSTFKYGVYEDIVCNIAICDPCYQKLPSIQRK